MRVTTKRDAARRMQSRGTKLQSRKMYYEVNYLQSLGFVGLFKVLGGLGGVNGSISLLPVGRADLTVLGGELESVHESESLINRASDRGVVDGDLGNNSLRVDNEDSTESNSLLLNEDTVISRKSVVGVSNKRDLHTSKTALGSGLVVPGQPRELRVGRGKENLSATLSKLVSSIGVSNDLSGAHKGEGQRNEGQNDPLSSVLLERNLLKNAIDNGSLGESGSGVSNGSDHDEFLLITGGDEVRSRRLISYLY